MSPALPYWLRLVCLGLAAGACSYFAGWLAAVAAAPRVLRHARRVQAPAPAQAAWWLLQLRLLPLTCSVLVVGGLCLPSYLWFEPMREGERWGLGFCLVAACGALLAVAASVRWLRAYLRDRGMLRGARCFGRVRVVAGPEPCLALYGVLRPRLLISSGLLRLLSPAQLEAGKRHELAHATARDNLKRLLIVATPAPGSRLRTVERAWARAAEWSADDRAVAGDAHRSVALASTLLTLARLRSPFAPPAPCSPIALHASLSGGDRELAARVRRLLSPRQPAPPRNRVWPSWLGALLLLALMLQPPTLLAAHRILELLVR